MSDLRAKADTPLVAQMLIPNTLADLPIAASIATRRVGATCASWRDVLGNPDSVRDLEQTLTSLSTCQPSARDRLELFLQLAAPLGHVLRQRVASSVEAARDVGHWLLAYDPEVQLVPLAPDPSSLSSTDRQRLAIAVDTCLGRVAAGFHALLDHDDPKIRQLDIGVRVLVAKDEQALVKGLADPTPEVRLKALTWARHVPSDSVLLRVGELLHKDVAFPVRKAAADMLGLLIRPPVRPELSAALCRAARSDPFSLVRMAALSSLARTNPLAASRELSYAERYYDSEPEVVSLARKLREDRP